MISRLCLVFTFLLALAFPASAAPPQEGAVTYQTFDVGDTFPGAQFTTVTGVLPHLLTGAYTDAHANLQGFLREGGKLFPLLNVVPQDVSLAGVTGFYRAPAVTPDGGIFTWSFIYHDGDFQVLNAPRSGPGRPFPTLTEAVSINDVGQVCGDFRSAEDGKFYGFRFTPPTTYLTIEVPSALSTACLGISQDGRLLVRANVGGTIQYFLWEFGTFTPLTIPDLPEADLVAFHEHRIAAQTGTVGVVWDGENLTVIDVPGATLTDLHGLQVDGNTVQVYGRYLDAAGVHHGFIATLDGPPARRPTARHVVKMHAKLEATDCWPGSKRQVCVDARRAARDDEKRR